MIYPNNGIFLSLKREWNMDTCHNMDKHLKNYNFKFLKEARHQRPHIVWFHLVYEMFRIGKLVVARGWGGKWEVAAVSMGFLFWGKEDVLELVVMVIQPCKFTKSHWIVHLKRVNFMACDLYLNNLKNLYSTFLVSFQWQ